MRVQFYSRMLLTPIKSLRTAVLRVRSPLSFLLLYVLLGNSNLNSYHFNIYEKLKETRRSFELEGII